MLTCYRLGVVNFEGQVRQFQHVCGFQLPQSTPGERPEWPRSLQRAASTGMGAELVSRFEVVEPPRGLLPEELEEITRTLNARGRTELFS